MLHWDMGRHITTVLAADTDTYGLIFPAVYFTYVLTAWKQSALRAFTDEST